MLQHLLKIESRLKLTYLVGRLVGFYREHKRFCRTKSESQETSEANEIEVELQKM